MRGLPALCASQTLQHTAHSTVLSTLTLFIKLRDKASTRLPVGLNLSMSLSFSVPWSDAWSSEIFCCQHLMRRTMCVGVHSSASASPSHSTSELSSLNTVTPVSLSSCLVRACHSPTLCQCSSLALTSQTHHPTILSPTHTSLLSSPPPAPPYQRIQLQLLVMESTMSR